LEKVLYDLKGGADMSPMVGILFSAVSENSQRLVSITEGMSQKEMDYKGPTNHLNSTAQLIKHIMYVDLNWVYRIKGQLLPDSLRKEYGPMIDTNNRLPMIEGVSWNTLMSKYQGVVKMLHEACTEISDVDLDRVVTFGHQNEKQATIRWGLWHMADHNRYHQAHINQLRKCYYEHINEC
jgi:uncharacterized damage-inducible protein DinB